MDGTSIQDLRGKAGYDALRRQQDMQQMQYGAMHNLQHEQGHNAAHQVQQAQQSPYYTMDNVVDYPQNPRITHKNGVARDIEDLARDISDNLPEDSYAGSNTNTSDTDEDKSGSWNLMSRVPKLMREPLIIVILFVILSQPAIRDTIGKYVNQIVPNTNGEVSILGVIIYGAILATLFALTKKLLL